MELINHKLQQYAENNTTPEPPLLADLNRETHVKFMYPRMLSGHLQGRFLSMLSKIIRPKRILEVGTYTGYSALCMAEGLANDGLLHTVELNDENEGKIREYIEKSGYKDKIRLHFGNALNIIPELDEIFDMVFLDADKENYLNYYKMVFEKISGGGIIIADNTLWNGKVIDKKQQDKETIGIREFNEAITQDSRVDNVLLTVRDGLMLIKKR